MIRRLSAVVALLLVTTAAAADSNGLLPLWRVDGEQNRVYLLASVHLLRASDYPLPAGIYAAFDDAETLVMELDLDDIDAADAAATATQLGIINNDESLATLLGHDNYARAQALAKRASVPLEALSTAEPWFAAITIEQLLLSRIGFDASLGLENHLMLRAASAKKEILGLETLREQLEILDRLPLPVQRTLFMQTLEEGIDIEPVMDELIEAWRRGDTGTLEATVLEDMRQQPHLYRELVVKRNSNWATQVAAYLQGTDDYLVVVGTLHLVGSDGVPAMLRELGFKVQQLARVTTD